MKFTLKVINEEEVVFTKATKKRLLGLHPTFALDYLNDIRYEAGLLYNQIYASQTDGDE
jgi:hypothetical protein